MTAITEVYVGARRFDDMAHPTSPRPGEDWPRPTRWPRWQYALAVAVEVALLAGLMLAILAAGAVAGAVLGIDMGPAR